MSTYVLIQACLSLCLCEMLNCIQTVNSVYDMYTVQFGSVLFNLNPVVPILVGCLFNLNPVVPFG